jgi:molybdate transport system substrate-binding protein
LQSVTPFVAAILASAQQPEAGRELIAFLSTAQAKRVIAAKGLEPG